jgi:hypothetical protein
MACCYWQRWRRECEQFARRNIQCYLTGMHYGLASRDEVWVAEERNKLWGSLWEKYLACGKKQYP